MEAARDAAKLFDVEIVCIIKDKKGEYKKAPAVYLNDKVIAEIGFLKKGVVSLKELINELRTAGIPELPKTSEI